MCTCIRESEKKISDHLIETHKLTDVDEFGYANKAFIFDSYQSSKIYLPFEVVYTPTKKDGTKGRDKTLKTNIFPTFCPFCGVKYE